MTERKDTAQADEKIESDKLNQPNDLHEKNTLQSEGERNSEAPAQAEEPITGAEGQEAETLSEDGAAAGERKPAVERQGAQAPNCVDAPRDTSATSTEAPEVTDIAKDATKETPSDESIEPKVVESSPTEKVASEAAVNGLEAEKSVTQSSGARQLVFLMVVMPLIVAAMAGGGIWYTYSTLYSRPVEMTSDKVEIVVTEGTSASQALNLARNAGMKLPRWETKLLMRLEPDLLKRIHVGKFRFDRGMTPYDVLKTLSGPALIDQQLRIPEGAPIWEVMKVISAGEGIVRKTEGLSDEALMKTLGVEGRKSLEGLLAPETYRYGTGTTDLVILKKAIDHQHHLLEAAWESRSEDCQAKSAYELLILASIIEKETGEKGDRGLVSSVFNNRLRRKMALQTDPTVIYGLGPDWSGRLRRKELDTPTPWNTYTFVGLPPTPIAMPSAASIEAAAHPTKSNFLYFVARGDGTSEFSESLRQHNRAVKHFILEKRTTPLPGSKSPKSTTSLASPQK